MSLGLPRSIANYFAADQSDSAAFAACFTPNAVVTDEGQTHRGQAAIEQWKADAATKYQYTVEPFAFDRQNGRCVVTSKVSGNFPGSPVDLKYFFGLEGDQIASLEIVQ